MIRYMLNVKDLLCAFGLTPYNFPFLILPCLVVNGVEKNTSTIIADLFPLIYRIILPFFRAKLPFAGDVFAVFHNGFKIRYH